MKFNSLGTQARYCDICGDLTSDFITLPNQWDGERETICGECQVELELSKDDEPSTPLTPQDIFGDDL